MTHLKKLLAGTAGHGIFAMAALGAGCPAIDGAGTGNSAIPAAGTAPNT